MPKGRSMPASNSAVNYRHLLLVGVAMPAGLALANRLILNQGTLGYFDGMLVIALFGFYVLQVAGVGWAVAKFVQPWPLRWIIYAWTMLLIDLQLLFLSQSVSSEAVRSLSHGIFAGQLSLFVVWGILAGGPLVWRLPALLVVLWVYLNFYSLLVLMRQPNWMFLSWSDLVVMQTVVLSILCGALRLAGFSLALVSDDTVSAGNQQTPAGPGRRSLLQFGIRDVLIATTSLALLLALAKAGDLLTLQYVRHIYDRGFLFVFTIAIGTAAVVIVALWSALGRGHILIRAVTLLAASLAVGWPLGWYCVNIGQPSSQATMFTTSHAYWLDQWYSPGYWWLGWMFLTGALLAASLVIYRTLGYRLVRVAFMRSRT
jgi:hypothetical protein